MSHIPIFRVDTLRALEASAPPDAQLMAHAGRAAADLALQLIGDTREPVLVLCGPGNNGGDALVMARHLLAAGRAVCGVSLADPATLPADAAAAWQAFHEAGGVTQPQLPGGNWSLAVDGLFGIGLTRPISGVYADWITAFNQLPCPRLALDVPSGLNADTGAVCGPTIRATHTLTFIGLKSGLLTLEGPDHCGQLQTDTLGLTGTSAGALNAAQEFAGCLTPRPRNSHKGRFGTAAILGGSLGMAGALLLACRAALQVGAGRVVGGSLDAVAGGVDVMQPEVMLRSAAEALAEADVLAIGPGLGTSPAARALLQQAIGLDTPLVLDADALNLLAQHPVLSAKVAQRRAPTVLTPHPAEAARLLACTTADIQADRIIAAQRLAQRFAASVVLKGCGSVLAQPDGRWWINPTGNPGMASAGMGDVLTGLLAGLLAQGWPAGEALRGAVWLHGAAADECVQQGRGPVGLFASELLPAARALLNRLIHTRPALS